MDSVFVDTDQTDVKLCPGDRTHHEIINRSGFRYFLMFTSPIMSEPTATSVTY